MIIGLKYLQIDSGMVSLRMLPFSGDHALPNYSCGHHGCKIVVKVNYLVRALETGTCYEGSYQP